MDLPKISIITPSYNQGQFLEKTILSVLNQDYPNIEYIIIDGGSTDNSVEIIKKYESKLAYWVSEKDKGTYEANNKGLKVMTGDYWCVVNSDDILLSKALHSVAKCIQENPGQKWFAGGIQYIDENDFVKSKLIPKSLKPIAGFTFLTGCWVSHPTVFLHKEIFARVGSFRNYHAMDLDYWLHVEKYFGIPFIIDQYIAGLRMHKDCKSANLIKLNEDCLKVYESFVSENELALLKDVRAKIDEFKLHLIKLRINHRLVDGSFYNTARYLAMAFFKNFNIILKRWYWGAIKRLFFGVKAGDPILRGILREESKANWNEL